MILRLLNIYSACLYCTRTGTRAIICFCSTVYSIFIKNAVYYLMIHFCYGCRCGRFCHREGSVHWHCDPDWPPDTHHQAPKRAKGDSWVIPVVVCRSREWQIEIMKRIALGTVNTPKIQMTFFTIIWWYFR